MSQSEISITPIGNVISSLLKNKCNDYLYKDIFLHWEKVVGNEFAKISIPYKTMSSNGKKILVLKVQNGYGIEMQHESHKILNFIHKFYGDKLFSQIKIIQTEI